jgi:hypothetical protein
MTPSSALTLDANKLGNPCDVLGCPNVATHDVAIHGNHKDLCAACLDDYRLTHGTDVTWRLLADDPGAP